eukprot:1522655-Amphidinium_carterae.1
MHFYHESAIMHDEELQLMFISSLLALENVVFHADSKWLSRQCLAASLSGVHISPVPWPLEERRSERQQEQRRCQGSRPDDLAPSGFGTLVASAVSDDLFDGFIAVKRKPGVASVKELDVQGVSTSGEMEVESEDPSIRMEEGFSFAAGGEPRLRSAPLLAGLEVRLSTAMMTDSGRTMVLCDDSDSGQSGQERVDMLEVTSKG